MNWQRLNIDLSNVIVFCILVATALTACNKTTTVTSDKRVASSSSEFEEAISLAEAHLTKDEFAPAFDLIMAAARIAPSDPRLIDAVVRFIEKAKSHADEDVAEMAEDLLDRGDSFVHFQSPKNVQASRERITKLRESFSSPTVETVTQQPNDSIIKLLLVAENTTVSVNLRSRAAELARNVIDNAEIEALATANVGDQQPGELAKFRNRIDSAEKQCLKELFAQLKPKCDKWLTESEARIAESNLVLEVNLDSSKPLTTSISEGLEHLQAIIPYSKSSVEEASAIQGQVEERLKTLQRQKTMLNSKQALQLVREIEAREAWSDVEGMKDICKRLAQVDEASLSPYVLNRHNQAWEKVFGKISTGPFEDKWKEWAMQRRILGPDE